MIRAIIIILTISIASPAVPAQSLKDILSGIGKSVSGTDSTSSGETGGLGALGSFLGNALASKNFSVDDLVGSWCYSSPAVSFQSDNALKKIGGAGAATALESKLAPYYTKLRLDKSTLTVAEDHTFEMRLGLATLKGSIEKNDEGELVFSFSAFGKINLGKVNAHATKAGNTVNITFDATRMIQILTKVAGALNNSTLSSLSTLINSYDGIYLGFKMKK